MSFHLVLVVIHTMLACEQEHLPRLPTLEARLEFSEGVLLLFLIRILKGNGKLNLKHKKSLPCGNGRLHFYSWLLELISFPYRLNGGRVLSPKY